MIAAYKGKSIYSKIIQFRTWSDYSHISWIDDQGDGCEIEAWAHGGVQVADPPGKNHTPGTPIDLFGVIGETMTVRQRVREFLHARVGAKYDYLGNLHFVTRRPEYARDQNKWFCSELVFAAYKAAGVDLLARIPAWKVSPGMLVASPLLIPAGSMDSLTFARGAQSPHSGFYGVTRPKTPAMALRPICNGLQSVCNAVPSPCAPGRPMFLA